MPDKATYGEFRRDIWHHNIADLRSAAFRLWAYLKSCSHNPSGFGTFVLKPGYIAVDLRPTAEG